MGGIAGLILPGQGDTAGEYIQDLIAAMSWRGSTWRTAYVDGVALADLNPPSSAIQIVGDLHLDNAAELQPELGLAPESTHIEILAGAWQRWAGDCVKHLDGAFAFAVWDRESQSLFAARDHFGVKPFFYGQPGGAFAFASSIGALRRAPGFSTEPNPIMIGEYLLSVWDAPNLMDQTFFANLRRLPPAHQLTWRDGCLSVDCYWRLPKDHTVELDSDEAYIEAFRAEFCRAVDVRLQGALSPGCNLSGGLDSSTISVVARSLRQGTLPVFFTHSEEADESEWVQSVVDLGGYNLHRITPNSPLHDAELILDVLGEPFSYDNLDEDWTLAQTAATAGVDVLLNGYMGDSVVSTRLDYMLELVDAKSWAELRNQAVAGAENTGYAADSYFWSFVGPRLEELSRGMHWREFLRSGRAAAQAFGISFSQVLWHLWLRPVTPRPLRRLYREATGEQCPVWWEFNSLLNPDFVQDNGLDERASVLKNAWSSGCVDAREWQYANLTQASTHLALEQAEAIGTAHGLDTRFPFLDRRLMEFCYGMPRNLHGREGWDRWVMRKAFEDLLPKEVAWRKGKTEYSGSVFAGRRRDLDRMEAVIRGEREILAQFADYDRLLADWQWYKEQTEPTIDATKIGHRLWRFVVLATWLRRLSS